MAYKLSVAKEEKIVNMLVMGNSHAQIARALSIDPMTVTEYSKINSQEIVNRKKVITQKAGETAAEKIGELAAEMLEISRLALQEIKGNYKKASPAQLAVILGIMQDKYNAILGNPSQTIAIRFQSRDDMVRYIKEGKGAPPALPPPAVNGPVIDVEVLKPEMGKGETSKGAHKAGAKGDGIDNPLAGSLTEI